MGCCQPVCLHRNRRDRKEAFIHMCVFSMKHWRGNYRQFCFPAHLTLRRCHHGRGTRLDGERVSPPPTPNRLFTGGIGRVWLSGASVCPACCPSLYTEEGEGYDTCTHPHMHTHTLILSPLFCVCVCVDTQQSCLHHLCSTHR